MRIALPSIDLFKKSSLFFALLIIISHTGIAQTTFSTVANAVNTGANCYTLTTAALSQKGAVWYNNKIDLNYNFDISFSLNFGSNQGFSGGDGMAFVLQPVNTAQIGYAGSAKGYGNTYDVNGNIVIPGISPSIDIEYDTYDDFGGTTAYAALLLNGDYRRTPANTGVGQVPIGFVNNGQFHTSRVTWDATNKIMTLYFDGVQKFTYQKDIVTQIFSGQNFVYFGFTAATGGSVNQQSVCFDPASSFQVYGALPPPVPTITANGPTTFCQGGSVNLSSSAAKNSLQFNGSNYVEAANTSATSLTNALTVEAWVKTDDPNQVQYIVSKGTNDQQDGQYGVLIVGGKFQFHLWQSGGHQGANGVTPIVAGQWYHILGTWDGITTKIYVNGILEGQAPLAGPISANPGPLEIGRLGLLTLPYSLYGEIDEVRIWNTARTASEIQLNMNRNVTANPSLVAYYKLDDGTGTTTADAANGNTASLFNSPSWKISGAPINYAAYAWSTGANTPTITANTTGSYTVTVTDENGNTGTSNPINVVNASPAPTISASRSLVLCSNNSVILTSNASSGNTWSNGATTQSITVTPATVGSYTVTVSNGGCSATSAPSVVSNAPAFVSSITASGPTLICDGTSVTYTLNEPVPDVSRTWYRYINNTEGYDPTFNETGLSIVVTKSGNYGVNIIDANGCFSNPQGSHDVTVLPPPSKPLAFTVSGTGECTPNGGSVVATIDFSSGVAPINMTWDDGKGFTTHAQSINNVPTGIYTATVYDYCGTTQIKTFTVTGTVTAATITATSTFLCSGNTSAVSVSNVDPLLTYQWYVNNNIINGATGTSYVATTAGNYQVKASNGGCSAFSSSININAANSTPLTVSPTSLTNGVSCFNGGGTANADFSGGTAPHTFMGWTGPNGFISNSNFISNLAPGTYIATQRDFCGVVATGSITFIAGAALALPAVTASAPFCGNNSVTLTLGSTPYSFEWYKYDLINQLFIGTFSPNQSSIVLPSNAGYNYYPVLKDANNCNGYPAGFSTTAPLPLSITVSGNPSCGGPSAGSAFVNQTIGGKSPFTYAWTDGGSFSSSNSLINNIPAGTYTVRVSDVCANAFSQSVTITGQVTTATITTTSTNVCSGSSAVLSITNYSVANTYQWQKDFIDIPGATGATYAANLQGSYNVRVSNGVCSNGSNGIFITVGSPLSVNINSNGTSCVNGGGYAFANPVGGVGPFTFGGWTGPNGYTSGNTNINGLTVGTYTASYRDFCGNLASASVTINAAIPVILPSITASKPYCSSGESVVLTLGPTTYSFAWVEYDVSNTAQPFNWAFSPNQNSITVFKPGMQYYVVHTDANNCNSFSQPPNFSTTLPTPITFSVSSNPSCGPSSGSANVYNINGGKSPVSYVWRDGGTFSSTNGFITNLPSGIYTVTVTDACANAVSQSVTITGGVTAATITTTTQNICTGSSAALNVTNYNAAYTYQWIKDGIDIPGATGASYSANVQGFYSVRGSNGVCSTNSNGIFISISTSLSFTINATPSCGGPNFGSAFVQISGGKSPFTYSWTNGGTFSSTSSFISNLSADTYTCTVTDACGTQVSHIVTIAQLAAVTGTISGATAICTVGGFTTLTAGSNGTPATYTWSKTIGGVFTSNIASTQFISTTVAGNYSVSIKDINGCYSYSSINVTAAGTPLSLTVRGSPSCGGTNKGSASTSFLGALPMTVVWSDGGTFSSITTTTNTSTFIGNLPAGTYTATVTDACGTQASQSYIVRALPGVTGSISGTTAICTAGGSTTLTANSSSTPVTYTWNKTIGGAFISNIASTQSISTTMAGIYSVAIKDTMGCYSYSGVNVTTAGTPLSITVTGNLSCGGTNLGNATASLSGAFPMTVAWSNGGTFSSITTTSNSSTSIFNLGAGTYTATVTDACGVISSKSVTITVQSAVSLSISGPNTICNGLSGATLIANASGSTPTSYVWSKTIGGIFTSNIASTQSISATQFGNYSVLVNYINGCSRSGNVSITAAVNTVTLTVTGNTSCNGPNTGSASTSVAGNLPMTFAWTDGGTFSSTASSISGLHPATYSVTATDNCGLTATKSVTINEFTPAVITINANGPTTFCEGGSVGLTATTNGTAASYRWIFADNGNYINPYATTQTISLTSGGDYYVIVKDVNGCSKSSPITSVFVTHPRIPIVTADGPTTICPNGNVNLSVSDISNQSKYSLRFTGTNYVEAPHVSYMGLTKELSVEAWFKTDNAGATQYIVSKGINDYSPGQYGLVLTNGHVEFHLSMGGQNHAVDATTQIQSGKWYHAVGTWDSTMLTIYINGVSEAQTAFVGPMTANTEPLEIGRLGKPGFLYPFFGEIDEVRIWNTALTNGEINSQKGTIINFSNTMVANYRFEEGTGTTVADGGFGNPATLYNSPIWQSSTAPFYNYIPTYLWSLGGATTNPLSTNVAGDYTVTVSAGGCSNTSLPITVTTLTSTATITASGPLTICPGGSVVLTANSGTAYLWSNGSITQSITVNQAGNYSVTVTNANGCSATSSAVQVTVGTITAPVADISLLPIIIGECSAAATAPTAKDGCGNTITGIAGGPVSFNIQGNYMITWTYTDASGKQSMQTQQVIVKDMTAPSINTVPDKNVTATSSAGAVVTYTFPVGTDNCGVPTMARTAGLASGSLFPLGTTKVTFTATDAVALTTSSSFNVTVSGIAPLLTVPADITVNNDPGKCGAVVNFAATETTGIPASIITYSIASGTVFPVGTTTVTATATNAVGTSSKSFTVTVSDIEKPSFSPPEIASISIPYLQTPVSSSAVVTYNFADPLPANAVITGIELSYTAADQGWGYTGGSTRFYLDGTFIGGNQIDGHTVFSLSSNYTGAIPGYVYGGNNTFQFGFEGYPGWQGFFYGGTMKIHYHKTTNPAPISVNNDAGRCGAVLILTPPSTNDNCGVTSTTNNAPALFPVGTTTVTWTATDIHGNSNTATQTVTVTDNEPPSITAPPNVNVNTDLGTNIATNVSLGTPATNDNCGVATITNNAPASYPVGNTIVTWTVTDSHGLTAIAIQTVTVKDNQPPAITSLPDIIKNNDPGVCGAVVTYNLPLVNDNVSSTLVAITEGGGDNTIEFDLPVTNNVSNLNFSTTGNYKDILHGHGVNISVRVELYNPSTYAWTLVQTIQTGADDYHFGSSSINFPLISQVNKIRFVANQPVHAAMHLYEMKITLNSISLTQTAGLTSGAVFPVGTTINTFKAIDMAGNISTTSFTVTVIDAEKPVIVSSTISSTQYADVNCSWTGSGTAVTISDNCSPTLRLLEEYFDAKGNLFYSGTSDVSQGNYTLTPRAFPLGVNKVVLTVTDVAKNISDKTTVIVKVVDITNPTIMPSGNIIRTSDPAICGAYVKVPLPVSGDNCSVQSVVNSFTGSSNATGQYPVGTTIVTWTVTDGSGNKTTETQNITVTDNEPPVIMNVPVSIIQTNDAGTCGAVVTWAPVKATDNCGVISLISDHQSGETFPLGATTVTFIAKDKNNNTATASFTITITDNEAPKAITKPVTVTLVNGAANILPADINGGSSDNCGAISLSASKTTFTCADAGPNLVTLTVLDSHGNSSSATSIVTVIGETPVSAIQVTSSSTVYTGGVPTDIYLGYGSQSVTITDNVVGTTPITYLWTGSNGLSCNSCTNPTFAPTAAGGYAFTVKATNQYGCTATSNVSICVRDIRISPVAGSKVYVCHTDLLTGISQTLSLSTGSVANQLLLNPQDLLGVCGMPACTAAASAAQKFDPVSPIQIITKETEDKTLEAKLSVKVSPNPSNTVFTFIISTPKITPVQVRLMDEAGRLVEGLSNAPVGASFRMGNKLISGIYFAEVIQGNERVVLKLIKQN